MMQQSAADCQLDDAHILRGVGESTPGIEHASDYSGPQAPKRPRWTPRAEETIAHTSSRHSGPRAWRRALERSIAAGLLKGANATTVVVYEALAERMDYSTGHVRYCLTEVMARTGLSRTAVTDHVRILRQAGWLAWAEHGSLRNVMRQLGLPGYARTATVYAATIPPRFDEWAGNVLSGTGCGARVVGVTAEQRARMVAEAAERQQQRAKAATPKGSSRTPSLRVVKEEVKVQEVDGFKNTSRKRAGTKTSRPLPYKRRTPAMAAHDIWMARQVRPRVGWTQGETLRRLAVALRPLIDRGLDARGIAEQLHAWGLTWRPASPAAFIRCRLAQHAVQEAERQQMIADFLAEEEQGRLDAEERTWQAPADTSLIASALAGLQEGQARLSASLRAKGLDDLSGYMPAPAKPADDDWDAVVAALVATVGEEHRAALEGARA